MWYNPVNPAARFPRQFSVDSWRETLTGESESEQGRLDRAWYRPLADIFLPEGSAGGGTGTRRRQQRLFLSANTLAANEVGEELEAV